MVWQDLSFVYILGSKVCILFKLRKFLIYSCNAKALYSCFAMAE